MESQRQRNFNACDRTSAAPFATLLRRYRRAAGLTQHMLAERAGLSVRGISDLERGARRMPRLSTVYLLADALQLPEADRQQFFTMAQREQNEEIVAESDADNPDALHSPLLAAEWSDFRAALHIAQQHGSVAMGLRLATLLAPAFNFQGIAEEGRQWLMQFLAAAERTPAQPIPPLLLAPAALAVGTLAESIGAFADAEHAFRHCLRLFQNLDDTANVAEALRGLGSALFNQGQFVEAVAALEESARLLANVHSPRVAAVWTNLGYALALQGDTARAETVLRAALQRQRQIGDLAGSALALNNLAELLHTLGAYAQARVFTEESLALFEASSDLWGTTIAQMTLGTVTRAQGKPDHALTYYQSALHTQYARGDQASAVTSLEGLAGAMTTYGDQERAAIWFSTASALRSRLNIPRISLSANRYEQDLAHVRHALGASQFALLWVQGQATSIQSILRDIGQIEHVPANPIASHNDVSHMPPRTEI